MPFPPLPLRDLRDPPPEFSSLEELAALTGVSEQMLCSLCEQTARFYRKKLIPKRSGGMRELEIPSRYLRVVQRWILTNILDKLEPSRQAMAFRPGSRYGHKQNARCHGQARYGLALDLKDFFPSITAGQVRAVFSQAGYDSTAASILTKLCTLDGKLPQGSAASPALSNLVCVTMDRRLTGLCRKRGIRYTRYADDMYFSCGDRGKLLGSQALFASIIQEAGFTINEKKTRVYTPGNHRRVTGITVVQDPGAGSFEVKAPKELKRKVRAEIHRAVTTGNYSAQDHIRGEIAYIAYVEKECAHDYLESLRRYVDRLAETVSAVPELARAYEEHPFFPKKDPPPLTDQ